MGGGDTDGSWRDGAGGWGSRRPYGEFNAEDIRQFREEARRFAAEGRQLRDALRQQNIDARELEEILRKLRELEDSRTYKDVNELLALQSYVAEGMKRFEFSLRRKVGEDDSRAIVSGAEEVPQEFRKLVEEYYRSLSRGRQQQ
jgi:predicted ABC-class ATPase